VVILHTNDLHGKLSRHKAERIRARRETADYYFDCGDAVASGNIGIPFVEEPVWRLLELCGCTASVPGNREFHITEGGFRAKLAGAAHPILAANLHWKTPGHPPLQNPHPDTFRLDESAPLSSGLILGNVGVFGVMVPMVTEKMAAKAVSAFVNTQPEPAANACLERLKGCDVVICLSHLGLRKDIELATACPGIAAILGGHSHDVVAQPIRVGDTFILQAGSHARFVGRYELKDNRLSAEIIPMG
jgi:2',3'-cyclic-nucleotide 2'-phosphodiesterase (5'-nucleotidase family)